MGTKRWGQHRVEQPRAGDAGQEPSSLCLPGMAPSRLCWPQFRCSAPVPVFAVIAFYEQPQTPSFLHANPRPRAWDGSGWWWGHSEPRGPHHCTPTLRCVCWRTCKAQLCCTAVLQSHCSTPATAQPQTTAFMGTPNPSGSTSAPFHVLLHGVSCKPLKLRGGGGMAPRAGWHAALPAFSQLSASFQQLCSAL